MTVFADDCRIPLDGRTARIICAADRPDAITEGSDDFGAFLRFSTETGDISANEIAAYAGKLQTAPRRAVAAIEEAGKMPRWGKRLRLHGGLVVEPGPQIKPNLFVAFVQENAGPMNGQGWKSPPFEFGLVARNRLVGGKVVKDAVGVPILDEYLAAVARVLPDPTKQSVVAAEILSRVPLVRGAYNEIALAFADGRGGPGLLEFYRGSKPGGSAGLQGRYNGLTGFPRFGSVFPAFGVYCHVGQVSPIAVRIYNPREAPHD